MSPVAAARITTAGIFTVAATTARRSGAYTRGLECAAVGRRACGRATEQENRDACSDQ